MKWSFSIYRQFKRCQRQWYYKNKLAYWRPSNPLRYEAFILSQLQSVYAWRGRIVDMTISDFMIPRINGKQKVRLAETLEYARQLSDRQLVFAKAKKYRENGITKKKAGDLYTALYPFEYGNNIDQETLHCAQEDIKTALTNLFNMKEIRDLLKSSNYLIAQRPLRFEHEDVKMMAVPDLITFYDNDVPHIFDWKVHSFATKNYREQLATYALALLKCKPHKDFPKSLTAYNPTDIRLFEIQLLTNEVREYSITQEDVEEVEEIMAESIMNMLLVGADKKYDKIKLSELATTSYPGICKVCSFKKICWEE